MARLFDTNDKNLIGKRVRELRIARGLTQQLLADKLETLAIYICRASISRLEEKKRTVTDIEIYGLAKILRVSVADLFEGLEYDVE